MKQKLDKDSIMISIVAGVVAGLIYQVFVWLASLFGLAGITPFQIGAYMLVNPDVVDVTSISVQTLGMVQHFSLSILIALISIYLLHQTGYDHLIIKGIALGSVIYFLLYGAFGRYVVPISILQPDLATSVTFWLGNLIWGLSMVYVTYRMVRR